MSGRSKKNCLSNMEAPLHFCLRARFPLFWFARTSSNSKRNRLQRNQFANLSVRFNRIMMIADNFQPGSRGLRRFAPDRFFFPYRTIGTGHIFHTDSKAIPGAPTLSTREETASHFPKSHQTVCNMPSSVTERTT